ncbi:DUF362 domain-containing protein [Candidatus Omnitrophota bacterium]
MVTRRNFIKTASTVTGYGLAGTLPAIASRGKKTTDFFGVHEFIENHPEAVFIMRTHVDKKTNHDALKHAGNTFAQSVLVPKEDGVPVSSIINIIPNLTNIQKDNPKGDMVYRMGIVTDPWFVEGVIEHCKELGSSPGKIHLTETWHLGNWEPIGYTSMAQRAGVHMNETREIKVHDLREDQVQWIDTPKGTWFRKIPYIWPVNAPGSWLLNIAKFKAHGMGLTLCCKNLQGTICHDYQLFCSEPKGKKEHFNPRREADIDESYQRHVADGIPRWDKPKSGMKMENWAWRTLDNLSVTPTGLHIVEGVYGRDGDAFLNGPNPPGNDDNNKGEAWDYMTNIILFGKDPFRVDIIGHWLGGHEPGNFGLFHLAAELGMSTVLNPAEIPVYEWKDGKAELTSLDSFERILLKTPYLGRDYNGQNEPYYHIVDEPFDYSSVPMQKTHLPSRPDIKVLNHRRLYAGISDIIFEYSVPDDSYARVEILGPSRRYCTVLNDCFHRRGYHMTRWNVSGVKTGEYVYRMRWKDFDRAGNLVLL